MSSFLAAEMKNVDMFLDVQIRSAKEQWRSHSKEPSHFCAACFCGQLMSAVEKHDLAMFQELCRRVADSFSSSPERPRLPQACDTTLLFCLKRGGPQVLPFVRVLLTVCCTILDNGVGFSTDGRGCLAIQYAVNRREEELALELLRRCPGGCTLKQAEATFSMACGAACAELIRTLLRGEKANEKEGLGSIPRISPWALRSQEGQLAFFDVVVVGLRRPQVVKAVRVLVQEMGRDMLTYRSSLDRTRFLDMVAASGHVGVLSMLIDEFGAREPFLEVQDDEVGRNFPAMHYAAFKGRLDMLRYLIVELGMPISLQSSFKIPSLGEPCEIQGTSLHAAAASMVEEDRLLPLVEWLVENGLDPEIENSMGRTAADIALDCGKDRIYDFLTESKKAKERAEEAAKVNELSTRAWSLRTLRKFLHDRTAPAAAREADWKDEAEEKAEAARMALLAELDAEDEMQAKKKEKNKKKKEKKKNKRQEKSGGEEVEEGGGVDAAATALGGLQLFNDDDEKEGDRKEEGEEEDVPAAFLCGLTGKLMVEPVIAEDGISYEGSALAQLFFARAKQVGKPLFSPATGERMGEMSLPNHLLRTQIEEWMEERKKGDRRKRQNKREMKGGKEKKRRDERDF